MPQPLSFNLHQTRHARGLSQAQLASIVGVSQSYVSALERGLQPSDADIVPRLAKALDVSVARLLKPVPKHLQRRRAGATEAA